LRATQWRVNLQDRHVVSLLAMTDDLSLRATQWRGHLAMVN